MTDYDLMTSTRIVSSTLAPHEARRFVADHERDWFTRSVLADALLLVSETVTNAMKHGGAERMELMVRLTGDVLWAGVTQPLSYTRETGAEPGGLGTVMMDSLASRWGVMSAGEDIMVWFEIDRDPNAG